MLFFIYLVLAVRLPWVIVSFWFSAYIDLFPFFPSRPFSCISPFGTKPLPRENGWRVTLFLILANPWPRETPNMPRARAGLPVLVVHRPVSVVVN